jgi:hypothetical protein
MKDTIIKYLKGLPEGATRYQRKIYKKYGGITKVRKIINYDIKHGVTNKELMLFLKTIKRNPSYSDLRNSEGFQGRMDELETAVRLTQIF